MPARFSVKPVGDGAGLGLEMNGARNQLLADVTDRQDGERHGQQADEDQEHALLVVGQEDDGRQGADQGRRLLDQVVGDRR